MIRVQAPGAGGERNLAAPPRPGPPPARRPRRWIPGALILGILAGTAALGALIAAALPGGKADPVAHASGESARRPSGAGRVGRRARSAPPIDPSPRRPALADRAAVSVRASDGRILSAAGVVSFTGVSREADALVFDGVSVLGGKDTAERVVAPEQRICWSACGIKFCCVDGSRRPVGENLLYRLRGGAGMSSSSRRRSRARARASSLSGSIRIEPWATVTSAGDVLVGASPTRAVGNASGSGRSGRARHPPLGQSDGYRSP